jgi:serine O-acetyltransferase
MQAVCLCEGGGLRDVFRDDLDRYIFIVQRHHGLTGRLAPLRFGLFSQGLWATAAYRTDHYVRYRRHSRLLGVLSSVLHLLVQALTGIQIDVHAHIGPGLKIPHGGKIVIGPVRVGRNCDIYQGVTLGGDMSMSTFDDRNASSGFPVLGDRVWVGPGAVIAGKVTVGDDVAVGANSLLVRNVPPRGVVIGVPARLVSRSGSFAQVVYRGMDNDDQRKAALAADSDTGPGQGR